MKTRIIHSEPELAALAEQISESASSAVACLIHACATASPIEALGRIKFESLGYDPLGARRLNLIEQVNQTFTYLATVEALRYLFRHHAEYGPFRIHLGTAAGYDISSLDNGIIAEVFAAVTPESNQKLKKDACKLSLAPADYRYVFCACPGLPLGELACLRNYPGVRIVSLGVPMNTDIATPVERSERLGSLMQSVGFALWQLQELETTAATYLVVRVHASRGIGTVQGDSLLKHAEGRTFGALLKELAKSGVIEDRLSIELHEILEQRNWLVHRARRENRGVVSNAEHLGDLIQHLQSLADRSLVLQKSLATDLERYVLDIGVDRAVIDSEADRLARSWGLV